ncbi:unnamed protein product [Spirodela intermedia]|uniref:histone acetyltransferase n=1 Tax=Spirodela intermedia TaxID=51605 RepID=A0A7I8KEU3_SPIIN|nr:unnamed protein product [Spirodela intermedia]
MYLHDIISNTSTVSPESDLFRLTPLQGLFRCCFTHLPGYMDLGASAFTPVDLVGHNQCGNENEILSHSASSSFSGGSGILNPGMVHQREMHSMVLPSCGTFVSSANNDVFPSNMPLSGGYGGSSGCTGLDFGGNLAEMANHIAVNEMSMKSNYGNSSKPLQKIFDQRSQQKKLRSDVSSSHTVYHLSCTFVTCDILMVPNSNLSTLGLNGSYSDINPHGTALNFASDPAWFRNNLSFHNSEQINELCLQQNLQLQRQPDPNFMSHASKRENNFPGFSESKNEDLLSNEMSLDMKMQRFSQQMNRQNTSYLPQSFQGAFTHGFIPNSESVTVTHGSNWIPHSSENVVGNLEYKGQQELLLLYYHARICPDQEGACLNSSCISMKGIIDHMTFCKNSCNICVRLHSLLNHHRHCQDTNCPVCVPVRRLLCKSPLTNLSMETLDFTCSKASSGCNAGIPPLKCSVPTSDTITSPQHFPKRLKIQCSPFENFGQRETSQASELVNSYAQLSPSEQFSGHSCKTVTTGSAGEVKPYDYSSQGSSVTVCEIKFEDSEITDEEIPINSKLIMGLKACENSLKHEIVESCKIKKQNLDVSNEVKPAVVSVTSQALSTECGKENQLICNGDDSEQTQKSKTTIQSVDFTVKTELRKPNIKGVSLVESFTLEQVLGHMRSLKKWVGLGKARAAKNQAVENLGDKNSCQLCGIGALSFEPPPIYCVKCYGRIKHNRAYHTMANCDSLMNGGAGRLYLCNPCYNGSHGDSITYVGGVLPKVKLEKKRNDVQILELWVECDKCKAWQHQICALFNGKRNVGGHAGYTCPKCYLQEIENGECKPLPDGVILGAEDLPRSKLSDHIEQRLLSSLAQERQERARSLQKNLDEVPGVEKLTVRVVSSVDKKLEVKQIFRRIFDEENYPAEFPYKSKAILLFQKIEGADVCLFAMYVQEYGAACSQPNQRRVCLSYLDSVKYFRPDIKSVTGEALRTFVYHEILIGYLDYCKKRGFTSCHIWSCPPLKQEDFILNCHPEIQKTPKPDKLREWYLAMVRKAAKENVVVENTKLYDFFFMLPEDCKASVTAARLPYFDGDYWPGCAEDLLQSLQQIEDGKEPQKKGRMTITKRALKAARHGSLTDSPSKDSLLMFKLGEVIRPMKDDLIIIHLQHACSHCCEMIVAGKRWVCNQCKKFQLCEKCYDDEQSMEENGRHPVNSREKHSYYPVEVDAVPADTSDEDENLQSEFFDSRLAFLNLCQGNHYQYDTLRRAKHSTMMILYHLHNPTVPAFVSSCFHCHEDVEAGQGWHCETCPDYDLCNSCYQREGSTGHAHELVRQMPAGSHDVLLQKVESQQRQAPRTQDLLDLLVHASKCRTTHCTYPSCHNVKGLFHHGANCRIRMSGGCHSCKKMWYILHLHARACKEGPECRVPRCRDLKQHMRKMESQSNFRRRVGAMVRMRQLEKSAALGDSE